MAGADRERLVTASIAHAKRARALDPANVIAASLWLNSSASDGDPQGRLTAGLIEDHPGDWRAWMWRANLVSTPPAEKKAALARVAEMAPWRQEVLELEAYGACESGDWPAAERFAAEELSVAPWFSNGRVLYFTALERQGRCQDIKAWLAAHPDFAAEIREYLLKRGDTLDRPVHCVTP
jgi:hypothetical protein